MDFENQRIGSITFGVSTTFTGVLPEVSRDLKISFVTNSQLSVLISQDVTIGVDRFLTAVVTGTMAAPQLVLIDDAPPDVNDGTTVAELRLVHAASTAGSSVDFHITPDDAPAGAPLTSLSTNSASELLAVESASNLRMRVFNAGDTTPLWDSGSFSITAASRLLFVLLDYFGPGEASVRMIEVSILGSMNFPNEQLTGAVSLANMIPDRGPVDIFINDVLTGEDLLFGDIENYVDLAKGAYTFKLTTADVIDDVITERPFIVTSGEFQSVIATGKDDSITILTTTDNLRRVSTLASFAISHVAPSLGTIDVYVLLPGQSVDDFLPTIPQLQSPGHQDLRLIEGTYDLLLTETGTNTIVLGPDQISLDANGLYRFYITDSIGGGGPPQTILGYDFNPGFNP